MQQLAKNVRLFDAFIAAGSTFLLSFMAVFIPCLLVDIHYAPHDGQNGMGGFFLGLPIGAVCGVGMFIWALRWEPIQANRRKYWWKQSFLAIGSGILFLFFVVFVAHVQLWAPDHAFTVFIACVCASILVMAAWIHFAVLRIAPPKS